METRTKDIYVFDYAKAQKDCDRVLSVYIERYVDEFEIKENIHDEKQRADFSEDYLPPF